MRARLSPALLLIGLSLLLPTLAWSQEPPEPPPSDASQPATRVPTVVGQLPPGFGDFRSVAEAMRKKVEDAYFDVAPGFDIDTLEGSPSLSATSRIARAFDFGRAPSPETRWCSFGVFDGKGEWTDDEAAKNHAEAALSGTLHNCKVRQIEGAGGTILFKEPTIVYGFTADLRSKWGTFEEGEGDQLQRVEGNQVLLGAGFTAVPYTLPAWVELEELTAAYYQVLDAEGDLPVPEELDADHLQARVKSRFLPFVAKKDSLFHNFALVVDGRASWALDGPEEGDVEYYTSLAIEMGKDKMVGTIRWESGKEVGFDYDQKLVLGMLFRLFGADTGGGS